MSFRRRIERRHQRRGAGTCSLGNAASPAGLDGPKLSEVLLDCLRPDLDRATSDEDVQRVVPLAAIAWNAALLRPEQRGAMVHAATAATVTERRAKLDQALDGLVARKLRHFARDRRVIADSNVSIRPEGPHVTVLWSPPTAR